MATITTLAQPSATPTAADVVLVVARDPRLRVTVRTACERVGMASVEAWDLESAQRRLSRSDPDVVVMAMPDPVGGGLEVIDALRRGRPTLYVIALVDGLGAALRTEVLLGGVDDVMSVPFSPDELSARVTAVRRRRTGIAGITHRDGDLVLDTVARQATLGDRRLDLTRREFSLLSWLVAHPRQAFSRDELLSAVWGSSIEWQSAATVTEHVRRLRLQIEVDASRPERIRTVRGEGYRFDPGPESDLGPPAAEDTADSAVDARIVLTGRTVVFANGAAVELFRASSDAELIGRDIEELVTVESLEASASDRDLADDGRWPHPDLLTLRALDGSEVPAEVVRTPATWRSRPASQVILRELYRDPTHLYEVAIGARSQVADAVIITGADHLIRCFNPAAEDLYRCREADAVGRPIAEVVPWLSAEPDLAGAEDALARDGRWHGEVTQRRGDGTAITVRSSTSLVRDRFGRPVAVVAVNREVDPSTAVRRELDDADRTTATEVVAGIEAGEFAVRYRPVVRLADESLIGLEASVHWDHPRRGTLGPDAFLPIAERHGLMGSLGDLVFGEVCAQWARWSAAGHDLTISTGISGAQLADEHLPARWGTIVRAAGLPPGSLWLQVTETSLVLGLDRAADVLRRMSEVGACIAIDDFGTGWASLTYLRNLPIQALAIDRTFVAGLDADASGGDVAVHRRAKDRAIVSSIIALALELGLGVVAEGVDRQGQRNQLLDLGCTSGQGSLFGRPVAADDVDLTVPTVPLVHRG